MMSLGLCFLGVNEVKGQSMEMTLQSTMMCLMPHVEKKCFVDMPETWQIDVMDGWLKCTCKDLSRSLKNLFVVSLDARILEM